MSATTETPRGPASGASQGEGSVRRMVSFLEDVLGRIGPRETCGEGERRLAEFLASSWGKLCEKVEVQTFTCHPHAFLGVLPFLVLGYLLSLVAYWVMPPLAFLLSLLVVALGALEVVRYREVVDPLFPRAEGSNVLAVLPPRGERRRRVILSAHMDSQYECNLWYFFKGFSIPIMLLAALALLWVLLASAAWSVGWLLGADPAAFRPLGLVGVALYPVVGLFVFFHTYVPVPGATDDLAGVAVLDGVARHLRDALEGRGEAGDDFYPDHTEVVLLATGAEEAGLRGARRFVERNRDWLEEVPTAALFLDSVGDERHLAVVDRELFTGARHDPELVERVLDAAAAAGFRARRRPLVMGATDASTFSLAGLRAVTVLFQDLDRLVPYYHTRLDTLDRVRPQALAAALRLSLAFIEAEDRLALEDESPASGAGPLAVEIPLPD